MRKDFDYGAGGSEFRPMQFTSSEQECCDACSADAACAYWVRRASNGGCYLKKDQGGDARFFSSPGLTSGRVKRGMLMAHIVEVSDRCQ